MSTRVVDRIDEWDEQSFDGGYDALEALADRGFSGAIRANGAELYMTKGTVVGVHNGDIEAFETGKGTRYTAPSPALPLLAVMQEASDEVRAEYYTEQTAISEVDTTLRDGGFTGYIELAENVLSGDYYVVYHAGESMSVAFIGQSARLIDDDEAFRTADDEVGIYQVRPVEVEPVEIPRSDPEPEPTGAAGVPGDGAGGVDDEPDERRERDAGEESAAAPLEDAATVDEPAAAIDDGAAETNTAETESETETSSKPETSSEPEVSSEVETGGGAEDYSAPTSAPAPAPRNDGTTAAVQDTGIDAEGQQSGASSTAGLGLETRAVPSLDPTRTAEPDGSSSEAASSRERSASSGDGTPQGAKDGAAPREPVRTHTDGETAPGGERLETLEAELDAREQRIEQLESALDRTEAAHDELAEELERVRGERDGLATRVEALEAELERLETEFGAATGTEQRLMRAEALAGTDIFPRYESKSDATLKKAHGGSGRREDVAKNLRLEQNTRFDASAVSVDGQRFGEFLESTLEHQFVEWIVGELLFEIRETGSEKALADLYDALPTIDRADLAGTVEVVYTEEGQEMRSEEAFDIVLRNRMGEALVVANLNDSREGATESMMEELVRAAERVGQTTEAFAGAFLVTRSFFEPSALETASDATKGGLFSRDKRTSFVNLSRKQGYHLCLVEARNGNFTLLVPEL